MRKPLLECVPNVSEGRDWQKIELLTQAITSTAGVELLHRDVGFDANRTVFTFVGNAEAVGLAAKRLAHAAVEILDLRQYSGTHPFIGALDVCPFVALWGLPPEQALLQAEIIGHYLADELNVPVYFYEHSARRELFRSLAEVRRGGLAGVVARPIDLAPDLGGTVPHLSAGVTVVGARELLVAYNINLTSTDLRLARLIARELRKLPMIRAIGWLQVSFACAQVSINLLDFRLTGMAEVYLLVDRLASLAGQSAAGSELIGMVPEQALVEAGRAFGKLDSVVAHLDQEAALDLAVERLGLSSLKPFAVEERVLERKIE